MARENHIINFEKGVGKRGDYCLWHNGYRYTRNKTIQDALVGKIIYWNCELKCGVTFKTINDGTSSKLNRKHDHLPLNEEKKVSN